MARRRGRGPRGRRGVKSRALLPLALIAIAIALVLAAGAGQTAVDQIGRRGYEASLAYGAPAGGGASLLRPPQGVDHQRLAQAIQEAGIELPEGTSLYAARVVREGDGLRYQEFDAGDGAYATDFWPASSIKVVAAVGTLEFLAGMGFTGAATVTTDEGWVSVRDLYEEAIRDSSNLAYDWLVSIAGVDWLNSQFLVPRNGFTATIIQRSYTDPDYGVIPSPAMTISEGDRTVSLPARDVDRPYPCPDDGNCSDLLELTDTVRRIVLADEIPSWERFVIDREDLAELRQALLDSEGFIEAGAVPVLGPDVPVFNKPGEAPEDDCVDVGVVDRDYVLGITTPEDGLECATVSQLAEVTLSFLQHLQP